MLLSPNQTYTASFTSAESSSVQKDVFHLLASTSSRFRVSEVHIAQSTADYIGASEIELLSIAVLRGSSVAAGGATGAFVPVDGRARAAETKADLNSSTPGAVASEVLLRAGSMETGKPFVWRPYRDNNVDERPVVGLGERLSVRMSAPQGPITLNGTIVIEEIGKVPGE